MFSFLDYLKYIPPFFSDIKINVKNFNDNVVLFPCKLLAVFA